MKKKIMYLILTLAVVFGFAGSVEATSPVCLTTTQLRVSVSAAENINSMINNPDRTTMCNYGIYDGDTAVGVRLTVVDASGARIAGTVSIDLTNGHRTFTGTPFSYRNISPGRNHYMSTGAKKSRNEVVDDGFNYTTGTSSGMYYWPNMPSIGGNAFRDFFLNEFGTTYKSDMIQIFNLMHYSGYEDLGLAQNHYLLIEPIFNIMIRIGTKNMTGAELSDKISPTNSSFFANIFSRLTNELANEYFCDYDESYYFGTASEIFAMMINNGEKFTTTSSGRTFAHSIGTRMMDSSSVAGLYAATDTTKSNVWERAVSHYGIGSMHVNMDYIICTGPECPQTCPDGSPIPPDGVCPETSETPSECNYSVTSVITNDCNDGTTGSIEDGASWKCVFDAISAPKNTYQGEFYYPSNNTDFTRNPYCNVACKESVTYELPSTFEEVAGRKFAIGKSNEYGNSSLLADNRIVGTTTCSTAYLGSDENLRIALINFPQFAIDYADANNKVAEAWDNYQKKLALIKSENAATKGELLERDDHNCADSMMCGGGRTLNEHWVQCMALKEAYPEESKDVDCGNQQYIENPQRHCERSAGECPNGPFQHDGSSSWELYKYVGPQIPYTDRNGVTTYLQVTYKKSTDGNHGDDKPNHNANAEKAVYDYWVNKRKELLNQIMECNNYHISLVVHIQPLQELAFEPQAV